MTTKKTSFYKKTINSKNKHVYGRLTIWGLFIHLYVTVAI